jgi:hypothetical protein
MAVNQLVGSISVLISDKIGYINARRNSTLLASLSFFFLWIFAKTATIMIIFLVVYGFCIGAYLSSTVAVTEAICGLENWRR